MPRLATIERRIGWNQINQSSNCLGIHCPDAAQNVVGYEIIWECYACVVISEERFNNWMKELNQCLD